MISFKPLIHHSQGRARRWLSSTWKSDSTRIQEKTSPSIRDFISREKKEYNFFIKKNYKQLNLNPLVPANQRLFVIRQCF
ncbi:Uncharacterized protein TCM_029747 [Theobroma cacao]|uniref:Uncharacterized protein n=1 Tax=Theobroma cacao TaxID=3641 RepID=A0A061GLV3_THECC|nr:Uncharacterized protein TCM_029747 [Theobroma cacao]